MQELFQSQVQELLGLRRIRFSLHIDGGAASTNMTLDDLGSVEDQEEFIVLSSLLDTHDHDRLYTIFCHCMFQLHLSSFINALKPLDHPESPDVSSRTGSHRRHCRA